MNKRVLTLILGLLAAPVSKSQELDRIINLKCVGDKTSTMEGSSRKGNFRKSEKSDAIVQIGILNDGVVLASIRYSNEESGREINGSDRYYKPEFLLSAKSTINDDWIGASVMTSVGGFTSSDELNINRKNLAIKHQNWVLATSKGMTLDRRVTFAGACVTYTPDSSKNRI